MFMRYLLAVLLLVAVVAGPTRAESAEPLQVSMSEATDWVHHLVPLPKQLELKAKVIVPSRRVAVTAPAQAAPLITQAVRELRESLGQPESGSGGLLPAFTVNLRLGGVEAEKLGDLKNADQAYRVIPDADRASLALVARTPHGLYYASKTLQQLVRARAADGRVAIPLIDITDWPDMATRGIWGLDASSQVRWLSDRKFNYMEQIASSRIDQHKRPISGLASFKQQMVKDGPTYGISPVPAILHLEQISSRGLFEHYPEVKGKGEGIHEGAICYSNPVFTDILAEWMIGYLSMPGVDEVDVWMAENLGGKPGCQCDGCKNGNRDLLELRAILAAWEKARERMPNARLSILTSEETDDSNKQILQALPSDIRFWYYHSLLTYCTSEIPMVPGYLAESAARGRQVGVCLNLSPHATNYQPMTGAQFIHYRMTEFVEKKVSGFLGYPTPRVVYFPFNTEAAAEWSWNAKGRSPRDFAYSWAVRAGMSDPELFTEWAITHGEVAWDVYGSEYPAGEARKATGKLATQLEKGKLPEIGYVLWGIYPKPWGDIKTVEQLNRDVKLAGRSVELARRLDNPTLLHESLTIQGYTQSLKALYELKQLVTPDGVAAADRASARRYFQMYVNSLTQARSHLAKWETSVAGIPRPRHVVKVCELLDQMIREMTRVASELGLAVQSS